MSAVARFRPFGRRQDGPAGHEPDPWLDDPPPRGARDDGPELRVRAGRDRFSDGWDAGVFAGSAPATRAATPAMWAPRAAEPVDTDRAPVTDPFGFPPVPPVVGAREDAPARREPPPAWAAWVPDRDPGVATARGWAARPDP
ncbi:MAG: hypothetical protein M3235_17485, partial [Actinomycetota bacterium]|nr:hypothetical protein [Actinomycetota bacterium]